MTRITHTAGNMDGPGNCERMNSITDFKAILQSRQGPPNPSRLSPEMKMPAAFERSDAAPAPSLSTTGPAAPPTPPMSVRQPSERRVRPSRRFSEVGDSDTARRQSDAAALMARRRRATDSGCVSSVMQTVVEKRGLKHLAPDSDKPEPATFFPRWRSRGLQTHRRRHSTDGATPIARSRLSDDGGEHSAESHQMSYGCRRRSTFSVPETCSVPENRPLQYVLVGADEEQMSRQNSISFLESSVLMLTSNLAEASRREARLQQSIEELQVAVKSKEATSSSTQVQDLQRENEELQRENRLLSASLLRKTKVINSASAALPMVAEKASFVEDLGPLRTALNEMQMCALLELLSLGMSPHDVHCLLLGQSETGADIHAYAQLAGQLQAAFRSAEEQEDAIGPVVDHNAEQTSASHAPVTRALMAQLLKEQDLKELFNMGVSRTILAEVSLALMSGVDPWSIVNLLDGRVSRNSSLDITLAPELMGALRHCDPTEVGLHSPAAEMLAKLARRCSLCPMKALRQYNQELERTNIALGAQIEDLQTFVAKKQCQWTVERAAPAIPAELWRLDSIGSTGLPSPSQPPLSSSSFSIVK